MVIKKRDESGELLPGVTVDVGVGDDGEGEVKRVVASFVLMVMVCVLLQSLSSPVNT